MPRCKLKLRDRRLDSRARCPTIRREIKPGNSERIGLATLRGPGAPTKICHAATSPLHVNDVRGISESNGAGGLRALRPERPVSKRNAARLVWCRRDDAGPAAPDREVRAPRRYEQPVRRSLRRFAAEELATRIFLAKPRGDGWSMSALLR